jgi:hypothetical protein
MATLTVSGSGIQTLTRDDGGSSDGTSLGGGSYGHWHNEWQEKGATVTQLHADGSTHVTSHSRTFTSDWNDDGYSSDSTWDHTSHETMAESLTGGGTEIVTTHSHSDTYHRTNGDESGSSSTSSSDTSTSPLYVGGWSPPGYCDVVEDAATLFASRLFGTALGLAAVYGEFLNVDLNFSDPYDDSPATHYTGVYDWIGQNIVLPWVGQERLLQGGRYGTGLLDDLMVAGLLATEIVGYVDPTGVADVLNAGLNAADGNYADALLSLGGALIPGGGDKAGRAAGKVGSRAMDGFSSAAKSLSRHTACDAPTSLGRAIGNVRGACFVGDTLVVLDFAPGDGQPQLVGATPDIVDPEASESLSQDNLLLAAGITALLVGAGGAAVIERRTRSDEKKRRGEAVFAEGDLSDLIPNASDSLPEISGPEFDKLCERLFAEDNGSWLPHEVDDYVVQPDILRSTERLPRVASKAVANPTTSTVKRQRKGKQRAMTTIADRKLSDSQPSRTGTSSRGWRTSLLWLLPWLTIGLGCIGYALFGRAEPSSQNAPLASPTAHKSTATSVDTSHLSSQMLPAQQTGEYLTCTIRDLPVVTWILADNPETEGNLGIDYSLLDPADLRILRIRMLKPDGSLLHIHTLQSLLEMEAAGAVKGSYIDSEYPELGISGQGEVVEILPCPRIPPRPSPHHCLVTAKFEHEAATVIDLRIEAISEAIGVTTNHPIWSEDRQDFVQAGDLRVGETLLTVDDSTTHVASTALRPGRHTVYNVEVDGEHVYFVSPAGILVHNQCSISSLRKKAVREAWAQEQELVKLGGATRNWTKAERAELLKTGKVSGYQGHHINSVNGHPRLAGNANNIRFVTRAENLAAHGGNFRNPSTGALIDRGRIIRNLSE